MKLFSFQSVTPESDPAPTGASREYTEREVVETTAEQDWWWKPFWTLSALLMFVGIVWSLTSQLIQWMDRPVEIISISGATQHLDRPALGRKIANEFSAPFLQVDINGVQTLVKEQPWVRGAAVTRDWPNNIKVIVEEEVPVARWGERGLLNHQGDIFWPELKEQYRSLPRLSGPAPDTERVMSQFHDLNQMFRSSGLSILSLDLEARGAWSLKLNNQIRVIIGRENINERLERFLEVYQQRLRERSAEIEQIDIRYTHGVAVKWRDKTDEENAG
ncbi:MAG: cell division protein FtsQ/DivIB [Neptuniibacter sp.]